MRHVTHLADRRGAKRYRVGMSFSDLPPKMGVAIQRYVVKIEHDRRSLSTED